MSWFEKTKCLGFEERTMHWDQETGVPGYQEDIKGPGDRGTKVPGSKNHKHTEITISKQKIIKFDSCNCYIYIGAPLCMLCFFLWGEGGGARWGESDTTAAPRDLRPWRPSRAAERVHYKMVSLGAC